MFEPKNFDEAQTGLRLFGDWLNSAAGKLVKGTEVEREYLALQKELGGSFDIALVGLNQDDVSGIFNLIAGGQALPVPFSPDRFVPLRLIESDEERVELGWWDQGETKAFDGTSAQLEKTLPDMLDIYKTAGLPEDVRISDLGTASFDESGHYLNFVLKKSCDLVIWVGSGENEKERKRETSWVSVPANLRKVCAFVEVERPDGSGASSKDGVPVLNLSKGKEALEQGDEALWTEAGFDAFFEYLGELLDKLRNKRAAALAGKISALLTPNVKPDFAQAVSDQIARQKAHEAALVAQAEAEAIAEAADAAALAAVTEATKAADVTDVVEDEEDDDEEVVTAEVQAFPPAAAQQLEIDEFPRDIWIDHVTEMVEAGGSPEMSDITRWMNATCHALMSIPGISPHIVQDCKSILALDSFLETDDKELALSALLCQFANTIGHVTAHIPLPSLEELSDAA